MWEGVKKRLVNTGGTKNAVLFGRGKRGNIGKNVKRRGIWEASKDDNRAHCMVREKNATSTHDMGR